MKTDETFLDGVYQLSRFYSAIENADFTIDEKGDIAISKPFQNAIKPKSQTMRDMTKAVTQAGDPFVLLVYLLENSQSPLQEKDENTTEAGQTYCGEIAPETLVSYYQEDGRTVFQEIFFPEYEGSLSREALRDETIRQQYRSLAEPLNAILFSEESIPFVLSKNEEGDVIEITLSLTAAKASLYQSMYQDTPTQKITVKNNTLQFRCFL